MLWPLRANQDRLPQGDRIDQVIEVSLDDLGRILIPAALRRRLGLSPGDDLGPTSLPARTLVP
ncbi:MAG: AbrB/MazE/SpoVT family DNA-binding domain-containing protein [Anaerolineae bacterium]